MRILFFTTALEHTTFRKTAQMLQEAGAKVHIIGFTRNNYPMGNASISIESLGILSHENYISRFIKLIKIIFLLRNRGSEYDVIYNFTLDTLLISKLALMFKKKRWIYQIQDIRAVYFGKSLKNKLLRIIEKVFLEKVDLVVMSSENYYTDYYKPLYGLQADKIQIIENKLIPTSINSNFKKITNRNLITIGYFGVMRCSRSWIILRMLSEKYSGKFGLYLRGKPVAIQNLENEIRVLKNVRFGGTYKSPEDLHELYNQVDIVWAAYPYSEDSDGNWKYARTIRFYEACAFGKPVIVQKGTPQELDVQKHNIGLVVDMQNMEQACFALSLITVEQIQKWKENIAKLPLSYYSHTDEYKKLLKKIKEIE